uniref:Keratin n=1 Tax=Monopterus albus TaxID=43700 RepID=A0A3Q3JFL4_MONAL
LCHNSPISTQPACLIPSSTQPACLVPSSTQPACLFSSYSQPAFLIPSSTQPACLVPSSTQPACLPQLNSTCLTPVSMSRDLVVGAPAFDCCPIHCAPTLYGSSCRWWTHGRTSSRCSFRLSPAWPREGRPGHQALAFEPQPQA